MSDTNTCRTCKHFSIRDGDRLGSCERWRMGYQTSWSEIALNEVLVENDEGWGAAMGPEFGCVLHEVRS